MNFLEKLYIFVRALNMNDDDKEAKLCGISTNFIRKWTDLFFIIISEKASTYLPLNKTYYLRKFGKTDRSIWNHVITIE